MIEVIFNQKKQRLTILEDGKEKVVINGDEAEKEFRRIEYLTEKKSRHDHVHAEV